MAERYAGHVCPGTVPDKSIRPYTLITALTLETRQDRKTVANIDIYQITFCYRDGRHNKQNKLRHSVQI